MTQIALDGVGKRFADGTQAVREASFTVRDGEFFILVGPSGCGKSTVLNMIVGLETPSAGEIRVDGQRVNELGPGDRNMAMVFQSYALYPHMSVRENLSFPLEVAGMKRARIDERVARAAALLELEELLDRRPAALSGGQRQRVAMGRAIVREPAAFLLDEPLSNLDARLRGQMRTEIARLQKRLGTTTIYVTHDQTEAMVLGDRVAVLRAGAVQQVGTPRELYESPRNLFVASFVGAPGMNFLPARIEGRRLVLPMASVDFDDLSSEPGALDEALAGRSGPVIAGVRPEHLHDAAFAGDRTPGPAFRARVEVLEWMGSESYVHFAVADAQAAARLGELARGLELRRGADGRIQMVARVGAQSAAAEDREIALALDAAHLHLFDPDTGERLSGKAAA